MTKITLPAECTIDRSNLTPTDGGYNCKQCNKKVTDYTQMTDAQMLAHIAKYGIGCGDFKESQLNRDLTPSKLSWIITMLFALIFTVTLEAQDSSQIKHSAPDSLSKDYETKTIRRFGTGNIATIRHPKVTKTYTKVSLFWGLIKFRYPSKKPNKK